MHRSVLPILLLCLVPTTALGLQQRTTEAQRLEVAELVITGEVTTAEPRWAAGPGRSGASRGDIETWAVLAVEQVLKGTAGDTVEVWIDGGRIGEHATVVEDQPWLQPDSRYTLYLGRDAAGRWHIQHAEGEDRFELHGASWVHQVDPVADGFVLNLGSFPAHAGTPEEIEEAYLLALAVWNVEGDAQVHLPYHGQVDDTQYGGGDNGNNTLMWEDYHSGGTLGMARYNYSGDEMTDCDIQMYGSNDYGDKTWSFDPDGAADGEYDFAHTVIHEMGHCLGFSHSSADGAIMESSNTDGTGWERRHLHDDDIHGLQAMYGVATVALELEAEVVDDSGDGVVDPDEAAELVVTVHNLGDARAYELYGTAGTPASELDVDDELAWFGTLQGGASAAEAPGEESLIFPITQTNGCTNDGEATVTVDVFEDPGDWAPPGAEVSADFVVPFRCPDPEDLLEDDTGLKDSGGCSCGVAQRPAAGPLAAAWLLGMMLWRRRDQSTASKYRIGT